MGWTIGPERLIKHMQTVHANTGYTFPTALQVIYMYMYVCIIIAIAYYTFVNG